MLLQWIEEFQTIIGAMSTSLKRWFAVGLLIAGAGGIGLGEPAETQVLSDRSIRQAFESGDPKQVVQILVALGVPEETAKEYGNGRQQPTEQKFAWLELQPIKSVKARVLFLPCAPVAQSQAILLTQNDSGWKIRYTVDFDCHYDDSVSLQMLYLTSPKQFDLIVRHNCVEHGTGFVEQHLAIYRIDSEKMRKALDETDLLVDYNPPMSRRETSTFLPIKMGVLEQTRETVGFTPDDLPVSSSLRVDRRLFQWSEAFKKFRSSPFRRLR